MRTEPTGPVKWYAEASGKVIDYIFSKYPNAPMGRNYYGEEFGHLMSVSIPDHGHMRKIGYFFLEEDQFIELIYNPFKLRMAANARETSSIMPFGTDTSFDLDTLFDSFKKTSANIFNKQIGSSLTQEIEKLKQERDYYKKQLEDLFN